MVLETSGNPNFLEPLTQDIQYKKHNTHIYDLQLCSFPQSPEDKYDNSTISNYKVSNHLCVLKIKRNSWFDAVLNFIPHYSIF